MTIEEYEAERETIRKNGKRVTLTPRQVHLLKTLKECEGQTLALDEIIRKDLNIDDNAGILEFTIYRYVHMLFHLINLACTAIFPDKTVVDHIVSICHIQTTRISDGAVLYNAYRIERVDLDYLEAELYIDENN